MTKESVRKSAARPVRSYLLMEAQQLTVAHPTVQNAVHVDVVSLRKGHKHPPTFTFVYLFGTPNGFWSNFFFFF